MYGPQLEVSPRADRHAVRSPASTPGTRGFGFRASCPNCPVGNSTRLSLGAFLGAVPAVLVALAFGGLTDAFLTALLFLAVQQLEGNFLTPKIQGDTLHVHPILIFLGVIVGGGLFGILGVIVAVPALAVLRVLFDFLRVRLTTDA